MRHGNLMKTSRSRDDVTSETSICDTGLELLGSSNGQLHVFNQGERHSFLPQNQINGQNVKHGNLEPEIPGRAVEKEKKEKKKHSRIGHQQSPPPERRPHVLL